jgi:hypothetical protein
MATKKSRTRKSKSNDSQKKLLALVLIILFVGLGVFLVVSSFAAKGGKGKPGRPEPIVDSPYGLTVVGGSYGGTSTFIATDKLTGKQATTLSEDVAYAVICYQNGQDVGNGWTMPTRETSVQFGNSSLVWTSGGANCVGNLRVYRNGLWQVTATVNYIVAP